MISQIVGFTVLTVLALGGLCGAVIKYMLHGEATANAGHRTNESLWNEALTQSRLDGADDMSAAEEPGRAEQETKQHPHRHGGMKISHATA